LEDPLKAFPLGVGLVIFDDLDVVKILAQSGEPSPTTSFSQKEGDDILKIKYFEG
jgi:hypothetical protein